MTGERAEGRSDVSRLPDGGPPEVTGIDEGGDPNGDPVSADVAVERIRDRATDVRDAELDTALAKLEARGGLSETDREAVENLADSLVESLLAVPVSSLQEADATGETGTNADERTVETALELFG